MHSISFTCLSHNQQKKLTCKFWLTEIKMRSSSDIRKGPLLDYSHQHHTVVLKWPFFFFFYSLHNLRFIIKSNLSVYKWDLKIMNFILFQLVFLFNEFWLDDKHAFILFLLFTKIHFSDKMAQVVHVNEWFFLLLLLLINVILFILDRFIKDLTFYFDFLLFIKYPCLNIYKQEIKQKERNFSK
jgi:hypothetical protein